MKSRYDFYDESGIVDEKDGLSYPDPLSVNYNKGQLTRFPSKMTITAFDLAKFWVKMYKEFNLLYYQDLLLNENGVEHLMTLKPGDELLHPLGDDLVGFMNSAKYVEKRGL